MAEPTQQFLDATRHGSPTTPAGWTALALLWQSSGFSAADAASWVAVKIEVPAVATVLMQRSITPEDVDLIKEFFTPQALPPLEVAVAAIAIIKGLIEIGRGTSPQQRTTLLETFFSYLQTAGVTLGVAAK